MTALSIQPTFPIFTDIDGQPLEDGYVFIGTANLNPITNPITVYWDAALTLAAAQPIRTLGGYPMNSGTPARLYVNSDYSIQVQNKNGSLIYSAPAATERFSSAQISFVQSGAGAVPTTVQNKLREYVSVKDFGAVGDGLTDDTAALAAAFAAHNQLLFPEGTYLVDATGYPAKRAVLYSAGVDNVVLSGYGATIKFKNSASGPIGLNFVEIVNANNALIEGLTFDGNRQNQNFGYHAIAFFGGKNLTVRDVYAKNMYFDGIYVRASNVNDANTYPERVLIDNVVCDACGRNGTSIIGANGITLQNSVFKNTVGDPGAGVDVEPNVSDIYGVRNLMIDNCTFVQNDGRGLVITGNAPANPGETPYCINARITNTIAGKNSVAQNATIRGCDIGIFYAEDVVINGYSNTAGESYDPMDAGLITINNTAQRVSLSNLFFTDCNFTTNSKSLVYIDASNNDYRTVNGVFANDCNGVIVSGGRYTSISNIQGQNCTGSGSIFVGSNDSSLRDATLVSCPVVQARNTAGTGMQTLESLTFINPVGDALRIYGSSGSTFRDITIRNTGTATTRAVWIESLTNCVLENWKISDAGGYWNTTANAYLIAPPSLAGNAIDNVFPPLPNSFYEEGTWNVNLYDAATGGNISSTTATGYYTKIGRVVTAAFSIGNIDTTGMTAGNSLFISLPFTNGSSVRCTGSVSLSAATFPAGFTQCNADVGTGDARGVVRLTGNAGGLTRNLEISNISSGVTDIIGYELTYFV